MQLPFFRDYLWRNKANRMWWLGGLLLSLLEFILFKFRYPFANYMPDSYSYLEAASINADVNTWPVAYSKFLRLISVFTHSDKIVVGLQYFFLQSTTLLFLFSLLYFLNCGKKMKIILCLSFFINPLPLYIANYISADALFIGLSLLWLTSLIWIIYRPRPYLVILQALLLLACFTVRYNAIYYPLLSLLALILSRQAWKYKLIGVVLGFGLVATSVIYTTRKMEETTGTKQFSAFGGWQMANNALYMYEHIPATSRGPLPPRYAQLETMVRQHMDTLYKVKLTHDDSVNTFFYLWNEKGPLVQYLVRQYKKDSTTPYFKRWASEGQLYGDYAAYLIRKFPLPFAENFLWPNAIKYITPPAEFLGTYNMGADSVSKIAKDWFNYKSLKVQDHKKRAANVLATIWCPAFFTVANILFVLGLISVLMLNAIRWKTYGFPQLLLLVTVFWLANSAFSIFASPVVLRYQAFPLLVFLPVATVLIAMVYKMAFSGEKK